jgi:hypothetical protein
MDLTGYGRTEAEASQYQETKDFGRFFVGFMAFFMSAMFASLYTLLMIVLRPISGTLYLSLLILLFYVLGIFDRVDPTSEAAGIGLIFRIMFALA